MFSRNFTQILLNEIMNCSTLLGDLARHVCKSIVFMMLLEFKSKIQNLFHVIEKDAIIQFISTKSIAIGCY